MIAIEPLKEDKAREVVYQIVDGVQHLHNLNIVHLDLKVWRASLSSELYFLSLSLSLSLFQLARVGCMYMCTQSTRCVAKLVRDGMKGIMLR